MPIRIITDSTCDLPPDLIQRYGLHVIPIFVTLDNYSYRDGVDLSSSEFYSRLPGLKSLPLTAAPPPNVIEETFQRYDGEDLAAIFLASKFSSLYHTAQQAAQQPGKKRGRQIVVIDSGQLSLGLGWQVLAAAEAAAAGRPLAEVVAAAETARQRIKVYALLDTLEYVRHGGRVSAFAAALGGLLRIKVDVELVDGDVRPLYKLRTRHQAIDKLVELTQALGPLERLAILHAHRLEDAQALAERLAPCAARPPLIVEASGVVVTHVGPDALGVAAVRAGD
jgi:DegV family protein with EDD domain